MTKLKKQLEKSRKKLENLKFALVHSDEDKDFTRLIREEEEKIDEIKRQESTLWTRQ